ncbi:hypothetical protein L195_g018430, partial [Trifolium pratense]
KRKKKIPAGTHIGLEKMINGEKKTRRKMDRRVKIPARLSRSFLRRKAEKELLLLLVGLCVWAELWLRSCDIGMELLSSSPFKKKN